MSVLSWKVCVLIKGNVRIHSGAISVYVHMDTVAMGPTAQVRCISDFFFLNSHSFSSLYILYRFCTGSIPCTSILHCIFGSLFFLFCQHCELKMLMVKCQYLMYDATVFVDLNECISGLHNCNVNARCGNVIGSYFCQCHQGYSGDGHSCYGQSLLCFSCFGADHIYIFWRYHWILHYFIHTVPDSSVKEC